MFFLDLELLLMSHQKQHEKRLQQGEVLRKTNPSSQSDKHLTIGVKDNDSTTSCCSVSQSLPILPDLIDIILPGYSVSN